MITGYRIRPLTIALLIGLFIVLLWARFAQPISLARDVLRECGIESGPCRYGHIVAYNVDPVEVEREFRIVRLMMGFYGADGTITVIRVKVRSEDGSIGILNGRRIAGFYVKNLIVYDGTRSTLWHELAHFFYERIRNRDRSETVARLVERLSENL